VSQVLANYKGWGVAFHFLHSPSRCADFGYVNFFSLTFGSINNNNNNNNKK
jgi:hypothetical protein